MFSCPAPRSSSASFSRAASSTGARDAGQLGHLQPEAAVRRTLLDVVQEHDVVLVLGRIQVHVGHGRAGVRQAGQLEVVGREQGEGAHRLRQLHRRCPGEAEAVEGAGAAAHLVHQHEAAGRGVVQDVGGLGHLHHEGGAPAGEVIGGTDAGEDAVQRCQRTALAGTLLPMWASSAMTAFWRM